MPRRHVQLGVSSPCGRYVQEKLLAVLRLREVTAFATGHLDDLVAAVRPGARGGHVHGDPVVAAAVVVEAAEHHSKGKD